MVTTLRIDSRFRGPPTSGNGGYVAGMLAEALGGSDCQVTLRKPPPLDRDLELRSDGVDRSLWDGDELIAVAKPAVIKVEPPPPPDLIAAEAASARFAGHAVHIFPGCFVCGPERIVGDGLRIFAGPLGSTMVTAPWQPSSDLCDGDGVLRARFLWAVSTARAILLCMTARARRCWGRFAVHVRALAQVRQAARRRRAGPLAATGGASCCYAHCTLMSA